MELLAQDKAGSRLVCYEIWNRSETAQDLFAMEACARLVIGDRVEFPEKSLRILPKGTAWARDVYLMSSAWGRG
ncbi:hypothetical protein PENTCL1PPCAC_30819 [Pristionchus entomophagus]|uniref:ABM domain-containing protein n=1 Tax=Pristionchus entomophagus TaxID=358040 RepID=A0AAV5UNE7_9BILA|nr:hypothetical protein PENTCL1PPCAC_30819 [Pristionchus entomophagus]